MVLPTNAKTLSIANASFWTLSKALFLCIFVAICSVLSCVVSHNWLSTVSDVATPSVFVATRNGDEYIWDSGASIDLVGTQDIDRLTEADKIVMDPPQVIDTAAGPHKVDFKVKVWCKPLRQWIHALLMPKGTPKVVSAGVRCVDQGYGFWWPPYSTDPEIWKPVNNSRDNREFQLVNSRLQNYVPIATSDSSMSQTSVFTWSPGCAAAVPAKS